MSDPAGHIVNEPTQCEGCGYDLAGLELEGVCPECAMAVAASVSRRRGSPWQRRPGVAGWIMTTASLVTAPRAMWEVVRVDRWWSWNLLLHLNVLLASSGWLWFGLMFGDWFVGLMLLVGMFIFLLVITIAMVGAVRLLRRTPTAAVLAAAGHASGWWVIGAVATVAMLALGAGTFAAAAGPLAGAAVALSMWVGAGRLRYVGRAPAEEGSTSIGA